MYKVLVFVGSLRKASVNRQLALAIAKLSAGQLEFQFAEIGGLPHYDDDLWDNPPPTVTRLKKEIEAADAVLFVMPEFNRSFPSIVKNAVDWASRPRSNNSWYCKPGAVIGASPGLIGTAAGQVQLRSILVILNVILMGLPEIYFVFKPGLIDENSDVTDDKTKAFLQSWVDAFTRWIARHGDRLDRQD
nr:NADPH-dependent FMN reductase [Mesorhizobium sp.]